MTPLTPRCLVADDDPQIGLLLSQALARDGYVADVVTDGDAAARKLAEQSYALAVFDVLMPRKSGVELIREMRARGVDTPTVLMGAALSDEIVAACRHIARMAFLQKPFSLEDLRRAVKKAISPGPSGSSSTPQISYLI
jgi:DNA-binding response OmpR family regulator